MSTMQQQQQQQQQLGDDGDLQGSVEAFFANTDSTVLMAFRVAKSQASWSVAGRRTRLTTKPRILVVTATQSTATQKSNVNIQVLKHSPNGLQLAKLYKLKHLNKVEAVSSDNTGCSFVMGFDNLKNQRVAPPQWNMRTLDDRNRLLTGILKLCKENVGRIPKIIGMDVVEMALWAQANAKSLPIGGPVSTDAIEAGGEEKDAKVTVERELVSKAEEDDMEALLGTYVMGIDEAEAFSERLKRELTALEAANVHAILESEPLVEEVLLQLDAAQSSVDDMDEWLGIFNVKLRHMREDIESIEARNNMLEMQAQNNGALVQEMDTLLERLRVPPEYAAILTGGTFEEARMPQNVEACDWLAGALHGLEPPFLDANYATMRAVKDKRAELEKLKATFVRRASDFLRSYFSNLVDFMISDKSYFSQGQLKRPDHADLRFKCRTYARMLQHLKTLDRNSLDPLRKAYCHSLNLLLRREAREFANELRASTKVLKSTGAWLDSTQGGATQGAGGGDNSPVSEAYAKMLRIFIPLLVDESSFFASFMCFEVLPLNPPSAGGDDDDKDDDDISAMEMDGTDIKSSEQNPAELESLNQSLQELLEGIQEDFYAVVDWAYKIDPLRCISMQGVTERYLSGHKADAAGFVRRLLADLQSRISFQFNRFVDEAKFQIERHDRNVKQMGVLSYIPIFASLAGRMENLIQENSRDMVDQAYMKLVGTMFTVLERIAQVDPKYVDVLLLENYAAFQNRVLSTYLCPLLVADEVSGEYSQLVTAILDKGDSMFDLANVVPTLARFYQQASEAYEQACTRYINSVINYQFEKLFQFAQRVENLLYTISPEEVPFQLGFSKMDLRKILKTSLAGVEKVLQGLYKRMQKHLTSEELLPSLWEKFKEDFLDKYESLEALLMKCYPNEALSPSSLEMKEIFKALVF